MKVGDRVITPLGAGTVVEFYQFDNWCLVKVDKYKYKDFSFKISDVKDFYKN